LTFKEVNLRSDPPCPSVEKEWKKSQKGEKKEKDEY